MRQRVLLTALRLLTLVAAHAQKGLQIDSLFSGSILDVSEMSRISMSEVSGSDLKPYNLKYFRSISFKADPWAIDRVASLVEAAFPKGTRSEDSLCRRTDVLCPFEAAGGRKRGE